MARISAATLGEIRRATLTGLLRKVHLGIRLSEHLDGDGESIFRHACALDAEDIVALCGGNARPGERASGDRGSFLFLNYVGSRRSVAARPSRGRH